MERQISNGRWERGLARAVVVACALTAIAVAALHGLQPELNPLRRPISEYVHGPHGFLMTTTFFVQALGSLALATIALAHGKGQRRMRIGGVLFMVSALGAVAAGVFPADLGVARPETPAGTAHAVAGLVRFVALAFALPLLAPTLSVIGHSGKAVRGLVLLARLFVAVFVVSILILANLNLFGLGQRAFIAVLLAWMAIAVLPLARRAKCGP